MKGKKEKVVVVFNEKDRRDFLTGFRKRKNARRKKAQEEFRSKAIEKRKQLREEKQNALREHIKEYEEELEKLSDNEPSLNKPNNIIHDFNEHTVMVSTIDDGCMMNDFSMCVTTTLQNQKKNEGGKNRATKPNCRKDISRHFRKKAQKRKIQALSDKKGLRKERNRQIITCNQNVIKHSL